MLVKLISCDTSQLIQYHSYSRRQQVFLCKSEIQLAPAAPPIICSELGSDLIAL